MTQRWPDTLWIVRHGESAGNLARQVAYAEGREEIEIPERDVDVPLSSAGELQSAALGRWFAAHAPGERPTAVLVSPCLRARHTASLIERAGGVDPATRTVIDERLREKEFGVLDRLTKTGIAGRFPQQAELRARLGKFYHRPPGGESWCDVILRLRSVLDSISLQFSAPDSRLLIVAHQVIVLCLRYLVEELTEAQILAIDREGNVANCGVTTYSLDRGAGEHGALRLRGYNFVAPLEAGDAPVTSMPDAPVAGR